MRVYQTGGVAIQPVGLDAACERCGGGGELARIVLNVPAKGHPLPQSRLQIDLCADCLAEAIQVATGFNMPAQMEHWRRMRRLMGKPKPQSPTPGSG